MAELLPQMLGEGPPPGAIAPSGKLIRYTLAQIIEECRQSITQWNDLDMTITIYHNPRCSKSRQTLALLQDRGLQLDIVEYLKTPPNADELRRILAMLQYQPRQLMRQAEDIYKELKLDDPALGEAELIQAMVDHPKLIERPVVVNGDRAAIGRPPEQVVEIL